MSLPNEREIGSRDLPHVMYIGLQSKDFSVLFTSFMPGR